MARHLRIFEVEKVPPCFYVTPAGQGASFRYADLQMETNTVRAMVADADAPLLIIDLHKMDYFGSEFIGSLILLGREKKLRGGKVAICAASPYMLEVLRNMSLFKLWPYYDTREEAVEALSA
ncbi:STAS domain-containing protein [Rubinisphaera margarita]|uniref:STAS domain-containing protein n=1 Tax=Rubinisphaera margarita TaxID=2909586 RepID=UPI001EE8B08C|nr:STAS domain-containing protein [Rubinisphaera margarita]MCG6157091.1 STAS domain-containing protein [Rubinisphaera margarita]